MPKTIHEWTWEEAFQHHGFNDGEDSETWRVEEAIQRLGYVPEVSDSIHNSQIDSIRNEQGETWDVDDESEETIRRSLPEDLVAKLDAEFGPDRVLGNFTPFKVVVEVEGGVAEVTTEPEGVAVEIIDHDMEE